MNFGEKLQQLRKEKGMSQEDLAGELNVSRQAVSKWESNNGYPETEKMILLSQLFNVSLDYLMKEDYQQESHQMPYHFMNRQAIEDYLKVKKQFALWIALAVFAIIGAVTLPIMGGETAYSGLCGFLFLVIVGLAVFCMIVVSMTKNTYQSLEQKAIKINFADHSQLQNDYAHFHSRFVLAIAGGVLLIIVSLGCVVLLSQSSSSSFLDEKLAPTQLMFCVAIAVFLFVYFGILENAYRFLTQNEKYLEKKEEENGSIFALTMPLAAMIYLIMGFTMGWWHPGWVIFPITAFLSSGIHSFIKKGGR